MIDQLPAIADELRTAGVAVLPLRTDGSKSPAVRWQDYQQRLPEHGELANWFGTGLTDGLGAICGAVSGGLELLEFEGRAVAEGLWAKFLADVDDNGFTDLLAHIRRGWFEISPSGGIHLLYRVVDDNGAPAALPNTKLARRPGAIAQTVDVLVETRGEGGFVVLAPSAGRSHPTGNAWTLVEGGGSTVATITADDRDALFDIARGLDQMPKPTAVPAPRASSSAGGLGSSPLDTMTTTGRPGDAYNAEMTWDDILIPHGWTKAHRVGEHQGWTRPGKKTRDGISATTSDERLYVFSSSTPFDTEVPYTKFGAFAVLEHGGDHSAAARALALTSYAGPAAPARGVSSLIPTAPEAGDAREDVSAEHSLNPNPGASSVPAEDTSGAVAAPSSQRPVLDVTSEAGLADWLRDNLGAGATSGMFSRGDDVVFTPRVGEEGYVDLRGSEEARGALEGRANNVDGPAQVRIVTAGRLQARLHYAYRCLKVTEKGPRSALPSVRSCSIALNAVDQMRQLRHLAGVIHAPALRPDGTILATPGYDDATGLLYLPGDDLDELVVPDQPSADDLTAALGLIDELLAGFDFVTEDDRATYVGMLLTPLLRLICPPPYKLAVITAHQPGSGKTLLAQVARLLHGGIFRAELPEDDAELRKQLTSILTVTTGPVVVFDNITGTVRSSTLAALLTSSRWDDRPLGSTEIVGAANDRLWIATGNNAALGGDLARRTMTVAVDPGVPDPQLRTGFAIADLESWVLANRPRLLAALLTLARSWALAGARPASRASSDSYGHWISVVGGILAHAGVAGTFASSSASTTAGGLGNSDDEEWARFLVAIEKAFPDGKAFTVRELLGEIDDGHNDFTMRTIKFEDLPGALAEKITRAGLRSSAKTIGMWLRNRVGRWAGELTVRQAGTDRKDTVLWKIERYVSKSVQSAGSAGSAGSSSGPNAERTEFVSKVGPDLDPADPADPASDEISICGGCGGINDQPTVAIYCSTCMAAAREAS